MGHRIAWPTRGAMNRRSGRAMGSATVTRSPWPPSYPRAAPPAHALSGPMRLSVAAALSATARKPALARAAITRVISRTAEARRESAYDVGHGKNQHEAQQAGPNRPPARKRRHQWRAEDHLESKRRSQKPGSPDRHVEARGDVRHQAGKHELRGERERGDVSSPRPAPKGARKSPCSEGCWEADYELTGSGADGVTESPHLGCLRARHGADTTQTRRSPGNRFPPGACVVNLAPHNNWGTTL